MGGQTRIKSTLLAVLCLAAPVRAALVDFESIPFGTIYGKSAGHLPGDLVLTQDGIMMSLEILRVGAFEGFNRATVGGSYVDLFSSTPLDLNNISVVFDFLQVGFAVNRVQLDVRHFGGTSNFAVNSASPIDLLQMSATPQPVAAGVTAQFSDDLFVLDGPIDIFRIGGQELAIDNVLAVPEPNSAVLTLVALGFLARRRRRSA